MSRPSVETRPLIPNSDAKEFSTGVDKAVGALACAPGACGGGPGGGLPGIL